MIRTYQGFWNQSSRSPQLAAVNVWGLSKVTSSNSARSFATDRLMLLSQTAETIPTGKDVVAKDMQRVSVSEKNRHRDGVAMSGFRLLLGRPSLYTSAAAQFLSDDPDHHQNVEMFIGPFFSPKNHLTSSNRSKVCVCVFTRASMLLSVFLNPCFLTPKQDNTLIFKGQ